MKKILLAIFCSVISFFTFSQTQQGSMMIGGSMGVYSSRDNGNDAQSTTTSFSPTFGYFVKDNFAFGLKLAASKAKVSSPGTLYSLSYLGVGPFARFYKFTSNPSFSFFVDGSLTLNSNRTETETYTNKSSGFTFQISPGFSYFFTKHWSAELLFSGFKLETDKGSNASEGDVTVAFGVESLSPAIGVRYYFGNN